MRKIRKKNSDYRKLCEENNTPEVCDADKIAAVSEAQPSSSLLPPQPSDNFRHTATKFDVVSVVIDKCQEIGDALKSGSSISYLEKLKPSRALISNCLMKKCGVFPTSQEKELRKK